jgi:hypothetical protein
MPRPERALHSGDDRLTRFAADLRALREHAGRPGYRAAVAHYSVTTLSEGNTICGVATPTITRAEWGRYSYGFVGRVGHQI